MDLDVLSDQQKMIVMYKIGNKPLAYNDIYFRLIEYVIIDKKFPIDLYPNKNYILDLFCDSISERHFYSYIDLFTFLLKNHNPGSGYKFFKTLIEYSNSDALLYTLNNMIIPYDKYNSLIECILEMNKPSPELMKKFLELYSNDIPSELKARLQSKIIQSQPILTTCIEVLEN